MAGDRGGCLTWEARKVRADMPILMITGFADLAADTATHVIRLSKPFRAAELARAIRDVALVNSCPS